MHPDSESLQMWRDRELPSARAESIRVHVSSCESCQAQSTAAQAADDSMRASLRYLDSPVPRVQPAALAARARSRRGHRTRWLIAATLFVGLAGGAAAAPRAVRQWISALVSRHDSGGRAARARVTAPAAATTQSPARTDAASTSPASLAGIAVSPGANFRVEFANTQRAGTLAIQRGEGSDIVIRAPSGAATFSSSTAELSVMNTAPDASFTLEIPRTLQRLEIRVARRRVYLQTGDRVESAWLEDRAGVRRVPLSQPPSP
jgi:hypothetical protein